MMGAMWGVAAPSALANNCKVCKNKQSEDLLEELERDVVLILNNPSPEEEERLLAQIEKDMEKVITSAHHQDLQ
jgi:hypothetical protein